MYDHNTPWITHVSLQKHDTANGLNYRNQWSKPIVFDEYGYEGNIPEGYGRASGQDVMKKTYAANFSGTYTTHGECFQDPNEVIWWGKGGLLKGESWKRFKFLREMMQAAPPFSELKPGDSMLVKGGEYYLVYCDSTGSKTVHLSGTGSYQVECLDTWEMTVSSVGTASPGAYTVAPPKAEVVYRFTLETQSRDEVVLMTSRRLSGNKNGSSGVQPYASRTATGRRAYWCLATIGSATANPIVIRHLAEHGSNQ